MDKEFEHLLQESDAALQTIIDNHKPDSPFRYKAMAILAERKAEREAKEHEIEWHRYLMNAARNTMFAYWAAILTSNSIIIAVFSTSTFSSIQKDFLAQLLIIVSLISSGLIILNFHSTLKMQRSLDPAVPIPTTYSEQEAAIGEAGKAHGRILRNEQLCEAILFIQFLIIALKVIH